jgi:hypothetical protein
MAGGTKSGVTNFPMTLGSSEPPGICATARGVHPARVATNNPIVEAPVILRKLLRVNIRDSPRS